MRRGGVVMGIALFVYGLLTMFILSAASRNRREGRPNPAMVMRTGFVLVGVSIGASLILGMMAVTGTPLDIPA